VTSEETPLFNLTPAERREYEATTLRLVAAAHIENYLEHAGLQAKDLARRIRKSRPWVSKLLSGRQNATLDTLAEVGWALGARWNVDLVPAERAGTPAENDAPAPTWTSNSATAQISAAHIFPAVQRFGNLAHNFIVVEAEVNRTLAARLELQSTERILTTPDVVWNWVQTSKTFSIEHEIDISEPVQSERLISSATASLQISSVAS
jgi:antitoxin component HigA of HigAB toxin-antitoxin module